ncbi:hypothetical protein CJF30_00007862 [Rutstroemia sp. NJR-2017a BBW]|nr:hypothetical protein CJF30_00007862 [Rutstroemia sp. NJR-2017a BBW]
MINLDI